VVFCFEAFGIDLKHFFDPTAKVIGRSPVERIIFHKRKNLHKITE